MVEGAIGLEPKQRDYAVHIVQHILCRHTNNLKTLRRKKCIARGIASRRLPAIMRLTVDLHDQLCRHRTKVGHIRSDGMLAAEFHAELLRT